MKATSVKTRIIKPEDDLLQVIFSSIDSLPEKSVLVIASKVVALTQGALSEGTGKEKKYELMKNESEYYIDPKHSRYGLMITIKNSRLGVKAGVDCTNNPKGTYILWPREPQKTVNEIWLRLRENYSVEELGVVIADTTSIPLRKGFVGGCVAHCGFEAMNSQYKEDLFNKHKRTTINVAENAAVIGVSEMGEIDEQTPFCIIKNLKNIEFQDRVPTAEELNSYYLSMGNDVFAPVLKAAQWERGAAISE